MQNFKHMNQEIKVTNCNECPFISSQEYQALSAVSVTCRFFAFSSLNLLSLPIDRRHKNCPLNEESITFNFVKNEPRD